MPRGPTKPYLCYPLRVVITVDSCLLSAIIGGLTAVCEVECGSRANSDRALAKVVARVVARWGVSPPRRAHSCRRKRPGCGWGCLRGVRDGRAGRGGRVISVCP